MYNLVIDEGNTRIKVGIFKEGSIVDSIVCSTSEELEQIALSHPILHVIRSSVREQPIVKNNFRIAGNWLEVSNVGSFPIQLPYSGIGTDRIASACAAHSLYPNHPVLILDCGTCLTHGVVNRAAFLGGSIRPGLQMRFKALEQYTCKLPLVELPFDSYPNRTGTTTIENIQSGVFWGMVDEINELIHYYHTIYSNLIVLITGGDAPHFEKSIKETIFAQPDLNLIGLHSLIVYNVS
ncbi:MAG: type III pantothenate kinase [Cytophagaceae bacterium]|jgi:type III pantothenate kinase|nr:type III pantothenate kinase [Cytophagaceae bacterium]